MFHEHILLKLGISALAVLFFTIKTNQPWSRHLDAVGTAAAMVGMVAATMIAQQIFQPPTAELLNPLMDVAMAFWMTWAFATQREGWKLLFLGFLAIQCELHVIYQTDYLKPGMLHNYRLGLNLTFIAELFCVSWPGVGHVYQGWRSARLRHHRDRTSSVGA